MMSIPKSHALAYLFNNPIPDTLVNDKKIIQKSLLFNQTVELVKSSEIAFHNRRKSLDDDLGDLYSIQIVTYNIRGILSYQLVSGLHFFNLILMFLFLKKK